MSSVNTSSANGFTIVAPRSTRTRPQNWPEWLIWGAIVLSYPLYFLGLVFPVNTTLPWLLLIPATLRLWHQSDRTPAADRVTISPLVWMWLVATLVVLLALFVGLTDFNYDRNELIRSTMNWMRDWALFPICLFLGNSLAIRPAVIYRAVCYVCIQSVPMIFIGYAAYLAKLPDLLYNSPIERLTQNGKLFYEVRLYLVDIDSETLRFTLFAPWAPALGLVSGVYFLLALQESDKIWRTLGLIGAVAMLLASVSRGAVLFLPITLLLVWVWVSANRAYLQLAIGSITIMIATFSFTAMNAIETAIDGFKGARKSSSALREVLQRVALDRFTEAPIWGHGKQIAGPQILKKMPLGSHHTWIGLLFSHGLVGFTAILVATISTIVILALNAKQRPIARVALGIMLIIGFTSMGENMEKLAYLVWPALVLVGIALR
jgi:hypothetical protein